MTSNVSTPPDYETVAIDCPTESPIDNNVEADRLSYTQDTFEDARDTVQDSNVPTSSNVTRTRSLTDRRPSNGSLTTPKATDAPPLPTLPPTENNEDTELETVTSPVSQPADDSPQQEKPHKSPLLTAHRMSTSSLDEVNLSGPKDEEVEEDAAAATKSPTSPQASTSPPTLPPRDSKQGSFFQGFSPSLPSVPWGPPPVNKNLPQPPPPPAPPRKATGPFSWLSRAATGGKENKTRGRGNTGNSVSTLSSNPELAGRDGDAMSTDSKRQMRNSLRDQFKYLRMREEGGIPDENGSIKSSANESRSSVVGSPASIPEQPEVDGAPQASPGATSPLPATVNPNLAPGTVSGISAAASDASAPVNWELWQDVVNHGPSALQGSNAEELTAAIKRGIPQTIRGVIWQVLADSRNPELEDVYRELSSRSPERNRIWSMNSAASLNGNINGTPKDKDYVTSSRSSVNSINSTPAIQSSNGMMSPNLNGDKDPETVAKAQAVLESIRKKKAKEEAAALQKLEKAIRRDLGSRTSYSKYFLSQRNQDGLFGLCKAYALYDEGVGYAQGINFIVMPLLFNVSVLFSY